MRAIELVVKELTDGIAEAIASRKDSAPERAETDEDRRRRRGPAVQPAAQPVAEAAPTPTPPAGPTT